MISVAKLSKTQAAMVLVAAGLVLALVLTLYTQRQSNAAPGTYDYLGTSIEKMPRVFPNERPPRDDFVAAQAAGVEVGDSAEEIAALSEWYSDFYTKKEKSGPNPLAYQRRMADLAKAESLGTSPRALNLGELGEAKMLMIPFEFNGEDTIDTCDAEGMMVGTSTIEGPLHGTIPNPEEHGDNNTIWTEDFSIEWYEDLMFGDGVGVVRKDLNDGAGVDLTGVSATKWYEEQSEGLYTIDGDIYPDWIQLDHSVAYYGWDGDELNPEGTGYPCDGTPSGFGFEFTIDVANKLNEVDPDFDWAQYDTDGDQIVDHLMVIHAGVDNSAGGGEYGNYQLWAHSWDVYCDKGDGNGLTIGCQVEGEDTPDESDDIYIANYTHIPEDADIGVVVHEFGHDIGLPDYYDQTGATSNSTAHWIVMSGGSWSGDLGGSHPAAFNPWARYFFGWADPMRIDYDAAMQEIMIGSADPTPQDTEDSVWIGLPDQQVAVENMAGEGKGLHSILGNEVIHSLTKEFDFTAAASPVLSFTTYIAIEEDWDYTYVRASTDGENWDILLNEEAFYATADPNGSFAWLGEGGLTGEYEGILTYDLSAYAGESMVYISFDYVTDQAVQDPGMWLDNVTIMDGMTEVYYNDMEDTSDWMNSNGHGGPGWEEVPFNIVYPHYYMLEWRNDEGSIASHGLTEQYYSLAHDKSGWLVDKFSANVPGLLVWYRNNRYENNQAINGGREFAPPATGPKGELLLVDAHYEPISWSGGWWDADAGEPAPEFSNRRSAMDGAFTLDDTPAWMIHDYADSAEEVMNFGSKEAVPDFHDSFRSVPGWVFPGDGFVYLADQDSSVVVPAKDNYTTRVRALADDGVNIGADVTGLWGLSVGGQFLGPGNPGDSLVQYGIHVELVDQAEDGSYGHVKFWNKMYEAAADDGSYNALYDSDGAFVYLNQMSTANIDIHNHGGLFEDALVVVEKPKNLMYMPGSMSEGWVGVSGDDASSLYEAGDYVKTMGYDNLVGEPEPDGVAYFAMAVDPFLTNTHLKLDFDYVGNKVGTANPEFLISHSESVFGMQEPMPSITVKPVTYYLPYTAKN